MPDAILLLPGAIEAIIVLSSLALFWWPRER